jgi:hypothetical protein
MNFLEYYFHISPDHGTGSTEFLILVLVVAALLYAARRMRLKKLRDRPVSSKSGRSAGTSTPVES